MFVQVKTIREEDDLKEKSKGKTKEGAAELLTMGDLQSHRKMFNLLKNTFPDLTVSFYNTASLLRFSFRAGAPRFSACNLHLQVYSEETDNTVDKVTWSRDIPADILDKIEGGKVVPVDGVTVWIDPLDATQEYTGVWFLLPFHSLIQEAWVDQRP